MVQDCMYNFFFQNKISEPVCKSCNKDNLSLKLVVKTCLNSFESCTWTDRHYPLINYLIFRAYTENNDLRVKLLSGQKSFSQEQNELVMPGIEPGTYHSLADIVVATPGRLVDHLQKTEGFSLTHLQAEIYILEKIRN